MDQKNQTPKSQDPLFSVSIDNVKESAFQVLLDDITSIRKFALKLESEPLFMPKEVKYHAL